MAYRYHSSYSAQIRKSDHLDSNGKPDLHVHIFYNEGTSRKLLGRYRLPTLEPVFPNHEPELANRELQFLKEWLSEEKQQKKLQGFLEETLFDMHKIGVLAGKYGQIITDGGDTYITIRVPVTKRIR